ncbi:protein transport protein SEC31 homolog B [Prunus yedoensis var. nudiflora]|uniref:Protein transport protein SEC31 homolog B n=1 Tax=Prunus yedoensis var. nudiflora TaxID=2094558 RepID=A0A314ZAS1_PRUYE|nr:protein transport protein SEC31 homolog B [Prunus yedoensis var. nudiflora]
MIFMMINTKTTNCFPCLQHQKLVLARGLGYQISWHLMMVVDVGDKWNPDIATQLVVASDEDGSPALRLWDMRNVMSPVKEFVGHTKGVIAMSWCPNDSSYLLTCAKDNRTICWDTVSAEIVCEVPGGTNWNFDVHWYPKVPGVISASSFDGKIGIYNIEGCSRYGVGESDFGGGNAQLGTIALTSASSGVSEVYVHSLVTEHSLVNRSSEFEAAIQNGEKSEDDQETWGLLRVLLEDDGTARTKLITHLGFSIPEETNESVPDDLSREVNALGLEDTTSDKVGLGSDKEATIFPTDNGEDFFNNLPSPKADTPVSTSGDKFSEGDTVPFANEMQQEPDGLEESADPSFDESVQHALVVGDYKGAVAKCISANKMVIAHAVGASLWESTRDQYLKMSHSPYLKIVSAMVSNDLLSLVNSRPLKFWKETLALLCSFASRDEWTLLCDTLASKLIVAGKTLAATICYICAGNIDKTVEIWLRCLTTEHEGRSYVDLLQELMEKTIVLALASGQKRFSASLCKLVEKYAEILASPGLLTTAMEYLKLLGSDELSPELVILTDRIALSTEPASGPVYGADQSNSGVVGASSPYYQETVPSQLQPGVPGSQYGESYQEPVNSPYGRGYGAPAPYQAASQPHMFLPSQAPQVPQEKFSVPHVSSQPAVRPFIPSTPPVLKNVEQYQQPTLGSQLYPGTTIPSFQPMQLGPGSASPLTSQVAPVPGNKPDVL